MNFGEYMAAISAVKLLAPEEERQLWQACKAEDRKARQRLIESYQPLVCREASRWRSRPDIMDAVHEGTVGLI